MYLISDIIDLIKKETGYKVSHATFNEFKKRYFKKGIDYLQRGENTTVQITEEGKKFILNFYRQKRILKEKIEKK